MQSILNNLHLFFNFLHLSYTKIAFIFAKRGLINIFMNYICASALNYLFTND